MRRVRRVHEEHQELEERRVRGEHREPAERQGEAAPEVLLEQGYDWEQIVALKEKGVIP